MGELTGDVTARAAGEPAGRTERAGSAERFGLRERLRRSVRRRPVVPAEVLLPGPRWRRWVLVAPGLAVAGFVLLLATALLDDRHGKRAAALCHRLPVPWTLFALSWASLLCGMAAVVVCALFFRTARRAGRQGAECWQGTAAVCICAADVLAVLFEAVAVYGVHAEAGEAYWSCAGAAPGAAWALSAVLGG